MKNTIARIATEWNSATATSATWTNERIALLTKARELPAADAVVTHSDVVSFLIGVLAPQDHATAVERARIVGDAVATDRSGIVVPFRAWFTGILEGVSRCADYTIGSLSIVVPDVGDTRHASATVFVTMQTAHGAEIFHFEAAPDVPEPYGCVVNCRTVRGFVVERLAAMAKLRTDAERKASRMNLRKYLA